MEIEMLSAHLHTFPHWLIWISATLVVLEFYILINMSNLSHLRFIGDLPIAVILGFFSVF